MSGASEDEIERLARRMALVVSDQGETSEAGRAVGALARRLGMPVGQLKAIYMAGGDSAASGYNARIMEQTAHIQRLEAENDELRESLRRMEAAARSVQRERDALRGEAEDLHEVLGQRRTARRGRLAVAALAVLAVIGGFWLVGFGPRLHLGADAPDQRAGTPSYRTAVIRDRSVAMRSEPDQGAAAVATLPVGARLGVRRMFWHNLQQWVEIQDGGKTGYVLSTDVDLS